MKKSALLIVALSLLGAGCTTVPKPILDKMVRVQYWDGEWRFCQDNECRTHTRKTVIVQTLQPAPVAALPAVPLQLPVQVVPKTEVESILVHFGHDQSTPNASDMHELEVVLRNIQSTQESIMITGFTDAKGSEAHNAKLAKKRARFVANWLKHHGVKNKIKVNAKGRCCYVSGNDTNTGRAMNRRVEIKLYSQHEGELH